MEVRRLGVESNPYHSTYPSHSNDNAGSLTHCTTREPDFIFICLIICLFRTAPMAHGGSQARGGIRAAATATAMKDLSCIFDLRNSSWQPRSLAHILMVASQVHYCWATMGTCWEPFWQGDLEQPWRREASHVSIWMISIHISGTTNTRALAK